MVLTVLLITIGFVVVAYAGYTLVETTLLRQSRIRKRVANSEGNAAQAQASAHDTGNAGADRFPTISRIIASREIADRLLLMLMQAGVKLRPSEFAGATCGLALLLGLVMGVLARSVVAEFVGIAIGLVAPFLYLKSLKERRLTLFNRQLPDSLGLIASAIRSGLSVQRSMQMVAEEMPNPISEEFLRVLNETNVGLATDVALTRMAARVPSYDLQLVVTAVIIQQQIGGNLAEIIDSIAETIRERVRVEGEVTALTAEGRISGIVLTILPLIMAGLITILNPGYLRPLVVEPFGMYIIVGALSMQAFGALIIKRMLVLDY